MQWQSPLYIRASSHHVNIEYSVLRVQNGRGPMEVKKLVDARLKTLIVGEKGVVYCTSHAKCKMLARQLGCHYYYGNPNDGYTLTCSSRSRFSGLSPGRDTIGGKGGGVKYEHLHAND